MATRAICMAHACRRTPEIVVWSSHGEESLDLCGPHYLDVVREALSHASKGYLRAFSSITAWVPPQRS